MILMIDTEAKRPAPRTRAARFAGSGRPPS